MVVAAATQTKFSMQRLAITITSISFGNHQLLPFVLLTSECCVCTWQETAKTLCPMLHHQIHGERSPRFDSCSKQVLFVMSGIMTHTTSRLTAGIACTPQRKHCGDLNLVVWIDQNQVLAAGVKVWRETLVPGFRIAWYCLHAR